jgi:hypothetical protein
MTTLSWGASDLEDNTVLFGERRRWRDEVAGRVKCSSLPASKGQSF